MIDDRVGRVHGEVDMISDPQPGKYYIWRTPKHGDVVIIMTDDEAYQAYESAGVNGTKVLKTRFGQQGTREIVIQSGRFAGQNAFVSLADLYEVPE